jgi:hypothetical protein
VTDWDAEAEQAYHAFFERHHHELSRLAYLLTGESDAADDLAAPAASVSAGGTSVPSPGPSGSAGPVVPAPTGAGTTSAAPHP